MKKECSGERKIVKISLCDCMLADLNERAAKCGESIETLIVDELVKAPLLRELLDSRMAVESINRFGKQQTVEETEQCIKMVLSSWNDDLERWRATEK
jgi:hypothetical protein